MMDSESGSRGSQDGNLVGAFRPESQPMKKNPPHIPCTPVPSPQQVHVAAQPQGNFSVSLPWVSHPTTREWAQQCKQKYRSLSTSTSLTAKHASLLHQELERRNRLRCQASDNLLAGYRVEEDPSAGGVYQVLEQSMVPDVYARSNYARGPGCAANQQFAVLPDLPMMRSSRSMDSLRELQALRASSSISLSNGGIEFEGRISVPSFCKVPLAERFDLMVSAETSVNSIDVAHDEGSNQPGSPQGLAGEVQHHIVAHGGPQQFIDQCGNSHSSSRGSDLRAYLPVADVLEGDQDQSGPSGDKGDYSLPQARGNGDGLSLAGQNDGLAEGSGVPASRILGSQALPGMVSGPKVDRYGFICGTNMPGIAPPCKGLSLKEKKQEKERTARWRALVGKSQSLEQALMENPVLTKKLVRNGIPEELRGLSWLILSGGKELRDAHRGEFRAQLDKECNAEHLIRRDLHRTFPNHVYFQKEGGPGQQALFNVLKAYAVYDEEVCYVQGMGSIVAVLLLFLDEEDAFWTFVALMNPPQTVRDRELLNGESRLLFLQELPLCTKLNTQFDHLLQAKFPRLSRSLRKEGYEPAMYATKWWMTMFTFSLPFSHVVRVWDVLMLEGWKMGIRVSLAIMKTLQKKLRGQPFDRLLERLNPEYLAGVISPADGFIKMAVRIRVSRGLRNWERNHQE